jgi:hypothetical protein
MAFKSFQKYVEDADRVEDGSNVPDNKKRNGLADPDPGEVKSQHKPRPQDLDLAKQAIQIGMGHNSTWEFRIYKFLKKMGQSIPQVGNLVDQIAKPKGFDQLTAPQLGKNDKQPDVLSPSSADAPPAFYDSK